MNDRLSLVVVGMESYYLEDANLRWYRGVYTGGYLIAAMSREMVHELFLYVEKFNMSGHNDNESIILCGSCYSDFFSAGKPCSCYEKISGHHNYIVIISEKKFPTIETIFKRFKNNIKLKSLKGRRKQLEAEADGYYTQGDVDIIFNLQCGLCYYCMEPINDTSPNKYVIDHIVSLSCDGTNWPTNLALACRPCNTSKSWTSESYFIKAIRRGKPTDWCKNHKSFISGIKRQKKKVFENITSRQS